MSLIKKYNNLWGLRPFGSDFFEADDFGFDRMFNREWLPAVNISEDNAKFELELAVPGMHKSDFKLNVENGVLTISAEKKEETEEKKKNFTRQEYKYRSFSRSFTLPENAKADEIIAKYEDGILKLEILKKAEVKAPAKEIAIA